MGRSSGRSWRPPGLTSTGRLLTGTRVGTGSDEGMDEGTNEDGRVGLGISITGDSDIGGARVLRGLGLALHLVEFM